MWNLELKIKAFFVLAIVGIIGWVCFVKVQSAMTVRTVENQKILDVQNLQVIGKNSTSFRYLVITDKETFVVRNSLINGKFNNSDLFFRLQKGATYTFTVSGKGKSFLLDYRNILEAKKQ